MLLKHNFCQSKSVSVSEQICHLLDTNFYPSNGILQVIVVIQWISLSMIQISQPPFFRLLDMQQVMLIAEGHRVHRVGQHCGSSFHLPIRNRLIHLCSAQLVERCYLQQLVNKVVKSFISCHRIQHTFLVHRNKFLHIT